MARNKMIAIAASASVLVASCGLIDQEAALSDAIDVAVAADIDGASAVETECVTTALMTDIGVEGFEAAGVTAEGLGEDPDLLRTGDTRSEVNEALISCLDLNVRFAAAIEAAQLTSVDTTCVSEDAIDEEPLALALIDGTSISGPETAATVTSALTDAIRGCVDDVDFATVTGLDSPEALAAVLTADPFTTDESAEAQDRCVVEGVVTAVGIERLADLGITVENPDFLSITNDLTDDEFTAIVSEVDTCGLPENLSRYISETESQVGACASERLSVDEAERLANDRFRGRSVTSQSSVRDAVDECAEEAVDALFGPKVDVSADHEFFAAFAVREVASLSDTNRFEDACVARAFNTMVSEELLQSVIALDPKFIAGEPLTSAEEDAFFEFSAVSAELGAACIEPWKRIRQDLVAAGLSDDVVDCAVVTAGEDPPRMVVDGLPGLLRGEIAGSLDVLDGMDLIGDAIGECGSAADVDKWERYLDLAFGAGAIDDGSGRESKPIEA